ncbi:M23 family metallopeptidase [Chryseobacterium cheonjiense]|uniref:M23 family metallopeptidase n=1 Tax=Chryseobacterium cheonjiense TaxID=2728845 RepID=A0A7Y0A525_9FLAO|nr:M23 family metallopeptidase [Chryseobacterium cheonjiense]NML56809.1 M23 family metallopeptidase [Chryseobacterium cheonjiense]
MKILTAYCIIGIFFSFNCSLYGQFNTITPTSPQKAENPQVANKTEETKNLKKQTGKKFWKNLLNGTRKVDLKKELDSLKTMIKENSISNSKKWDMQKLKDSLILELQGQFINKAPHDFRKRSAEDEYPKITMPLDRSISVTSPYGTRVHPISGTFRMHNGIDLKAYYENVYAVMDGIVTETGWDPMGGGHFIKVKHYNRFETAYLHLSEIYYKAGEFVKAGFVIAKSGNSGNSTGAHLHFAVRENGKYINPVRFLNELLEANEWLAASYHN